MITLYGINNCDTIKKTRQWLETQHLEYLFHDYKKQGCSTALVTEFLRHFTYQELVNTRGTTWRNLSADLKSSLDKKQALKLMAEQPSIIKRPLINSGDEWIVGFDTERLGKFK